MQIDTATHRAPIVDTRRYDAVIFDMDGVVTDSAALHAAAWAQLFDRFLATCPAGPGVDRSPFSGPDYLTHVDGKPRYRGVADFLAARHIELPWGRPSDPETAETVCGLGNRKDRLFRECLERDGVAAFDSTVALVRRLRFEGLRTGVFSASRNCAQVLKAAGVAHLFEVRVDGVDADELGLPGKPDPAMLSETAARLGSVPERTVVVEDAEAGVTAGRNGGFALVVGIDRKTGGDRLTAAGADTVVDDALSIAVRGGFRRVAEVPDIFEFWPRVVDLVDIDEPAVLLDFDGTLAEIVPDPETAELVAGTVDALGRLAARCPVAVISGRGLDDLRARIPVPGIWLAGCHGYELMTPDGTRHTHRAAAGIEATLAGAAAELRKRLGGIAGALIEYKRFAVAVHFRAVPPADTGRLRNEVARTGRALGLQVTSGRKVVELRPAAGWDKGHAVRWILEHLPAPAIPIYLGDDVTDEDAFDAVVESGLAVVVRDPENTDRRTAARFSVAGPRRVGDLLGRVADLRTGEAAAAAETWSLVYEGYRPDQEKLREALCTLGNGYFATRGAAPQCRASEVHYPGTYVAGVFNRLSDRVAGQWIDNESLVNLPNWLPVSFRPADDDWFDLDRADLLDYTQRLDIRRAELVRRFRFRDGSGRVTLVEERRFVALHRPHLGVLSETLTAENWSGALIVRSTVDGSVTNNLVQRYRDLGGNHLENVQCESPSPDTVLLTAQTTGSRIPIAVAMRDTLRCDMPSRPRPLYGERRIGHEFALELREGDSVTLEKTAAVCTGRDHASAGPADAATRLLDTAGDYAELFDGHAAAWDRLWGRLRLDLDDSPGAIRTLRLHLLHLLQTLSPNTADLDVGVPARGLHGEAYRGHVFWDELFVLPVLNPRFPALTRSLLRYRHRRLPEARRAAAAAGLAGALFPWQSGSDGREESQQLHLNPLSGRWNPDPSRRAHHIGAAVAFTVWQYYQATGDLEFLADCGAELLVEIARFWSALADFDPVRNRYVLCGVIGPDEFHAGYPQAPRAGVDNNAYTNVMAAWTILCAFDALDSLAARVRAELVERLGVSDRELARWHDVAHRMYVPFHDGVISQFEGYEKLRELDWGRYRRRYGDIQRLDRIMEAEGDDVGRYRAGKQADVLMLFYVFSADELRELFGRLGYELPGTMIPRTIDYYLARTTHGSTLSALVHSWVLARSHRDRAMEFFERVLASDVADIQGGTTGEGIHLAAMAGSVDLVQRCFTGLEIRSDRLIFCPFWPRSLGTLSFPMLYRGHRLVVRVCEQVVEVDSEPGDAPPIEIVCRERVVSLSPGKTVRLVDLPGG